MQNKKQERSSWSIHSPLQEYAAHSRCPCLKIQASRARTRTRPAVFYPPLYGCAPDTAGTVLHTQCYERIPVRIRVHTVGTIASMLEGVRAVKNERADARGAAAGRIHLSRTVTST